MHSPSSASMRCRRPIARPCRQWGPAKPHIAAAGKRGAWATARSLWEDVLAQVDKAYYVAMLQLHAQHFLCEHLESSSSVPATGKHCPWRASSCTWEHITGHGTPASSVPTPVMHTCCIHHRKKRPSCSPAVFTTGKNAATSKDWERAGLRSHVQHPLHCMQCGKQA